MDIRINALTIINAETTPENHIDEIISLNPSVVLFIDAADFGGKPGEARVIHPEEVNDYTLSTHGFPLSAICAVIAQSIPAEIRIVGIQAKDCTFGKEMSEEVKKTEAEIAKAISRQNPPCR